MGFTTSNAKGKWPSSKDAANENPQSFFITGTLKSSRWHWSPMPFILN